jgi:hypothetical protein
MPSSIEEKRKSIANSNSDVLDARVIANYGDPGLDENYHFDVLSRYVVVVIESSYRVPTFNKWNKMIAIVARPKHLWVGTENGRAPSPNSQRRSDAMGNVSVGLAGSFTVNGIPRINIPYELGEIIKIKKISNPLKVGADTMFVSQFSDSTAASLVYGAWHTDGSTLPYFAGDQNKIDALRNKTIFQYDSSNPTTYALTLYKYQYEAFMLNLVASDADMNTHLTDVFASTIPNTSSIYMGHGGYVFKDNDFVNFFSAEFEDININNKQRVSSNECMPLIVTTPNSFPTPKVRAVGTIAYNPTYVVKQ